MRRVKRKEGGAKAMLFGDFVQGAPLCLHARTWRQDLALRRLARSTVGRSAFEGRLLTERLASLFKAALREPLKIE